MNGCVYRTQDNKCEFYSDYGKGIVSYCDFDDCEDKKPSKADRIRAMTDEELADHFTQFYYDGPKFYCPAVADVGEGACAANYDCRQCWLDWLKEEAKDD